jgi:hypothetical protein
VKGLSRYGRMGIKFIKRRAHANYAARISEINAAKLKDYRLWKATPARHSGRLTS